MDYGNEATQSLGASRPELHALEQLPARDSCLADVTHDGCGHHDGSHLDGSHLDGSIAARKEADTELLGDDHLSCDPSSHEQRMKSCSPSSDLTPKSMFHEPKNSLSHSMDPRVKNSRDSQIKFNVAWLNMQYQVQCHVKMLRAITPQDVFNLILEDTYSVFAGPEGVDPCKKSEDISDQKNDQESRELEALLSRSQVKRPCGLSQDGTDSIQSRRELRQSYKHLMVNMSKFKAIL